jgi:serine/threonine-protein kinase
MRACPECHRRFVDTQEACPLDDARLGPNDESTPPADVGRVLGNYRLISLLGEGGMGNIYVAAHTRLNRYAAIKLVKSELAHRRDAIARFFEEARTINRLKHPNIVESIDLVESADGAYCVLELLHGPSLKTVLAQGRLRIESAMRIGAQIADALHAVHALDIVHRDLKPDNLILIERNGRKDFVKLIDFGVAQMAHGAHDGDARGRPFGTPAYMAPEQAAGQRVDGRADVYALGVLLFEMITGIHPFPSTNDNEYILRHADDTPPVPSKVSPAIKIPKELDAIILRCLEKQPQGRYPSAATLAVALRDLEVKPKGGRAGWYVALGLAGLAVGGAAAAVLFVPNLLGTSAEATPRDVAAPAAPPSPPMPPPVAIEDVRPETITLELTSTPEGAKVFRHGETVALGVTPFSTTLVRAAGRSTRVRFELDGYEAMEVDASLEKSENISVALDKLPPGVVKRGRPRPNTDKPPKKPLHREGVMDPFAPKK